MSTVNARLCALGTPPLLSLSLLFIFCSTTSALLILKLTAAGIGRLGLLLPEGRLVLGFGLHGLDGDWLWNSSGGLTWALMRVVEGAEEALSGTVCSTKLTFFSFSEFDEWADFSSSIFSSLFEICFADNFWLSCNTDSTDAINS